MDIMNILSNIQQAMPEVATSYCVINGAFMLLEEVEKMGYREFSFRSQINMPPKLYKYFSNEEVVGKEKRNYSIEALENNTVFMQSPNNFDDTFDSEISIDYYDYERYRLIEYCRRSGICVEKGIHTDEIYTVFMRAIKRCLQGNNVEGLFSEIPESEIERLSNDNFCRKLLIEINKDNDLERALRRIIYSEYEDYIQEIRNTFRISCFSTTPYSQLMWAEYADFHRGFCVEYTVLPNDEKYKNVYCNLFPLIYSKIRPDVTQKLVSSKDKIMNENILWDIYQSGTLRKSIDWAFQNEWRLLLPMSSNNVKDYNASFFPITKVYLGNKMKIEQRKQIIEICNRKRIPYVGLVKDKNVFEMKECEMICGECPKLIK